MTQSKRQFQATAPYFMVKDLMAALDYYHEKLGFNRPRVWGDPPSFAMSAREGFTFMLQQAAEGTAVVTSRQQGGVWDAYVWVQDAAALFAEFEAAGALIEYPPRVEDGYGMKEFAIRDLDGHVIAFGEDIA